MQRTTDELLNILKHSNSIDAYMKEHEESLVPSTLSDCLNQLLTEKSISKKDCIKASGLDKTYGYQLFAGQKTNPSRKKLLALCLAMKLSVEETQAFLKRTGYPILYSKLKFDSIILFALSHSLTVQNTNDLLYEKELPILE